MSKSEEKYALVRKSVFTLLMEVAGEWPFLFDSVDICILSIRLEKSFAKMK